MESLKEVITELRALQAVVSVLTRARREDREFQTQVIDLVNHISSQLSAHEAYDLRLAAQNLLDG